MSKIDLYNLGLSARFVQEATLYGDQLHLARVSVQHKDMYQVLTEQGEIKAEVSGKLSHLAATSAEYPAVGDWVLVDRLDDHGGNAIIHHLLTRKSYFERKAAGTKYDRQIVAANIDTIFICMALNSDYNLRRLERYLSIAWDSMAMPVVLLTKADLCEDLRAKLLEIESIAMGADVIVTSSRRDDGYTDVFKYLAKGKTVAFIGSSGVGKSTLINKLLGQEILVTNGIRDDDKGRHTTTHRQLLMLPEGGVVIDTPGMRELQIAGADLAKSFADIQELAETCCYRDCQHESEPKCGVRKAIAEGRLPAERLDNYLKMQKELVFEERKGTMTAARAEKEKFIDMMGSLNSLKQIKQHNRKNKR